MKRVSGAGYSSTSKMDLTQFSFKQNSIPDVIVRHSLEMSLIFVCNFGGLLGMWLGTSTAVTVGQHNVIQSYKTVQI